MRKSETGKRAALLTIFLLAGILLGSGIAGADTRPLVVPIAAGEDFSLAVLESGGIAAWGANDNGQLGDGTRTQRKTSVLVSGMNGVAAVAAGDYHSLALKENGTVWAWGWNDSGQLGDGTTSDRITPVPVSGLSGVVAVAAGDYHSLALKQDGTVWAWGDNWGGQLGDGTTTDRRTPVQVGGLNEVTAIAAGTFHSLAVKSDGTVWTWGKNGFGQLGDGTTIDRSVPVPVSGLGGVKTGAAGGYHCLARKNDGTAWAWGWNSAGQLGDGTLTQRNVPIQVAGINNITLLAAGGYFSLAVKSDGTVWAWGNNGDGQLGDGTTTQRKNPVQVNGLSGAVAIEAGYNHSLTLNGSGTVWSWGDNDYGQLGDGTITTRTTPVQVTGLGPVKQPGTSGEPGVVVTPAVTTAACGQAVTVNLTATAINNPEFQLWVQSPQDGSWSSLGDYSSSTSVIFSKQVPGVYTLMAFAKSQGAPYSSAVVSPPATIDFTKSPAVRALVVSGPNGAQPVGSDATFTAAATDVGGSPRYQFWLHDSSGWRVVRDYSAVDTHSLYDLQSGSYVIAVYALDQLDITAGNWTAAYYQVFILNVGSSLQLTAPPAVGVGSQVNLLAEASGITGVEYQYWYQLPDSNWHQSGAYSTSGSYAFTADQPGIYTIVAFAKDHYAPATDQFAVTAVRTVNSN